MIFLLKNLNIIDLLYHIEGKVFVTTVRSDQTNYHKKVSFGTKGKTKLMEQCVEYGNILNVLRTNLQKLILWMYDLIIYMLVKVLQFK